MKFGAQCHPSLEVQDNLAGALLSDARSKKGRVLLIKTAAAAAANGGHDSFLFFWHVLNDQIFLGYYT